MIQISDAAADKITGMLKDIGAEPSYFLRLGVSDGGCSGLSYSILFDDSRQEDDRVIEWKGFEVVIGNASEEYFEGVHIDYMETGMTGGFYDRQPQC